MPNDLPVPWRDQLSAAEADTVRRLAQCTGRPTLEVCRAVSRSPRHEMLFQVVVELATGYWTWLDQDGRWRADPTKQSEKLFRYAAMLFEDDPCDESSPSS